MHKINKPYFKQFTFILVFIIIIFTALSLCGILFYNIIYADSIEPSPNSSEFASLIDNPDMLDRLSEQLRLCRDSPKNCSLDSGSRLDWMTTFLDNIEYLLIPAKKGIAVLFKNTLFINIIYSLISLCFLTQLILLLLRITKVKPKVFFNQVFFLSEWAINSPPVLGVVGTIFSFAMLLNSINDTNQLMSIFQENFAAAAITTIMGGLVYVINLLINFIIYR